MTRTPPARATGWATIALAVGFNVPYAVLAATFDYPDILRRPPDEALTAFAAGGPTLIWTWYAFALFALALAPIGFALALTPRRISDHPALAIGAAILAATAAVTQAIGLLRWVFVVPDLARLNADPAAQAGAEATFAVLNAYGGVAIGEHLGQLLTALFAGLLATLQWGEGRRTTAGLGALSAVAITAGTGEGLALALDGSGDVFSLFTITGFLVFTAWLIATGADLLRARD